MGVTYCVSGATEVGPEKGTLVIVGGGLKDQEILKRFVELAGGPSGPIVIIPTAGDGEDFGTNSSTHKVLRNAGATNLSTLHTRDRKVADTDEFIKPLLAARGVWIGGGRQWRLADAYLHTKTHKALFGVLERGGVIGGSSAGATIQGSYMVRGDVKGNTVMMSKGHEESFGFVKNVAVDQHLIVRQREEDMLPVIKQYPQLLGIGIDENTAIIVQGDRFEVMGASKVAIYDPKWKAAEGEKPYYFLEAGDHFDLKTRQADKRR